MRWGESLEPSDSILLVIGLIPARGGSKGIRDKNLLSHDGQYPAFITAARLAAKFCERVVVSSDSPEILAIAQAHGFEAEAREAELARDSATIDEVAELFWLRTNQDVLVILPTVANLTTDDIERIAGMQAHEGRWVLTVPATGLYYHDLAPINPRVNRQYSAAMRKEVGVRLITGHGEYQPVPAVSPDLVEIDTPEDLLLARHSPKKILFLYAYSNEIGSGHYRRCTAISRELQHHEVSLAQITDPILDDYDVVVVDALDTERNQIATLASKSKVMTIEDLGHGSGFADLTINALYNPDHTPYVDLRPEFWGLSHRPSDAVSRILMTFGGTDPANLAARFSAVARDLLNDPIELMVVHRDTPVVMAAEMARSDIVVTSAGRTLHEAAYLGVPAIAIAANVRETMHCHLGHQYGNHYLGHHERVTDTDFAQALFKMVESFPWRHELASRRYLDHYGVQRLARLVERLAED